MNKIDCDKCEHNKVCRFKVKLGDVSRKYENFITDKVSYPFVTSLICEEFKEVRSMPRGTFHIEPTPYYGTGAPPYPGNLQTYTTNTDQEGVNE